MSLRKAGRILKSAANNRKKIKIAIEKLTVQIFLTITTNRNMFSGRQKSD